MGLKNKIVLITGAGGFVGSHLTEKLVSLGARVKCFIRYNSRNDWGLLEVLPPSVKKKINLVSGDLKDPDSVYRAVKKTDIVFHLGALIAIPYSYINPRNCVETNVLGTLNILIAARDSGAGKIIHTSTSEVYGSARYVPMREDHPLQAQSPYSASKISADKLAESFYLTYGVAVTTVRPFNTYGPRQSGRSIIPTIISQAILGDEIRIGSSSPRRDFTYVTDLVDAFIRAADSSRGIGEVINIGTGKEIAVSGLVREVEQILGKRLKVIHDKERVRPKKSEVERLCADAGKAKRLLGWSPKVGLREGLKETVEYIRLNISRYKSQDYIV